MSKNLSEDQINEYREAFALFDKDGGGSIDADELGGVMRSLGQNPSEADLKEMIRQVDVDGNGTIDFDEFLGLMASKTDDLGTPDDVIGAFKRFDRENKGYLTPTEMILALANPGETSVDPEIQALIEAADKKKDGKIDYAAFVKNLMPK